MPYNDNDDKDKLRFSKGIEILFLPTTFDDYCAWLLLLQLLILLLKENDNENEFYWFVLPYLLLEIFKF